MSSEELKLIRRAQRGDPRAFAEIYDQHQPAIYRYCVCRVGSDAVAEDLTSEVFVRLVEGIDDFTYRGRPLLAWLYTVARNLVYDHHRLKGKADLVELDGELEAGLEARSPQPEEVANLALDQERLTTALEQLTEEQRQVIVLKFFEGMDNVAAAEVLEKSYGAVKALQHRGLEALRRALEE